MMDFDEIKEYLLNELKEERSKWLLNKENYYSYIFLICNDIGLTELNERKDNTK